MAKRRLNKKVALVGFAVAAVFVLVAVVAVLSLGRDPQEAIAEAEAAIQAAREATDEPTKDRYYQRAARSFRSAYGNAETDPLREEILFKMVDLYLETSDWPYVLGSWNEIVKVNPDNATARYGRLKYYYILANSGYSQAWKDVQEQASDFLKVAENTGLLMEDTAKWDVFEVEQGESGRQRLGPYLYLVRGRAALEMANLGTVTDRDASLAEAVEDLKKVQEYEPNNIDAYWYLARTAVTRGEIFASRGDFEERDRASKQALEFLEQAVEIAGSDPKAHINLLSLKLMLVRSSGTAAIKEQIRSLEPEFVSLSQRFGSSAAVLAAVSDFYSVYSAYSGPQSRAGYLDKAIEAAEEAVRLDDQSVAYALNVAGLCYRRFSIYGRKADMSNAVEISKNALALPDAQETVGPRRLVNVNNRYRLFALLAQCHIEQILNLGQSGTAPEAETWLAAAEQAVHEIEQILGSGEDPRVVKWRGMLDLAKGDRQAAIRKLYAAYERLKAVKPPQPPWPRDPEFAHLAYTLAGIFRDTSEVGAVNDFLISALYSGIGETKPEARLDYIDVVLKFNRWADAIRNIDAFEEYCGANLRSQNLRVVTHIRAKQFDEADRELSRRPEGDPDTMKLRLQLVEARVRHIRLAIAKKQKEASSTAVLQGVEPADAESADSQADAQQFMTTELSSYRRAEAGLLERLLPIEPNAVEQNVVIGVCRDLVAQGETSRAKLLVDRFLEYFPDNPVVLVFKQMLSEPEPRGVPPQRVREIEEQVVSSIADPISRAVQLGILYRKYDELDKATDQLSKALESVPSEEAVAGNTAFEYMKIAATHLMDTAIGEENWGLAEQVIKTARANNLDDCQGQAFATRLAMAKGDFEDALVRVDDCLRQKPVFSHAYLLRSRINSALGNEHASLEDIRRAVALNPLDGAIAKGSASALYYRNQELGDNVSSAQIAEARDALEKAIALNPGDFGLLGLYAEYIAPTEPLKAVAIRQDLNRAVPNVENALLLGKLAMEVAAKQADPDSKETLFAVAGSAFEQARQIDASDKRMLYYYAEYLRTTGQGDKAKGLLEESQDEKLLWDHYFQAGQYDDARRILERLYKAGTRDSAVLRGLMVVAERTSDKESVQKYSEELISVDDTVENNLAQIQAFLRVGLVKEAERKLQSVRERYPSEPRIPLLQAWLAMRQGQLERALELTNKGLQSNPDNPIAWRLKGEINFFRADYEQAISDLRQSKLLLDESATRISLAKAYMAMERYEDAITELKNTIDAPGAPLEARSMLEHIFFRLDRKSALKRFYEETLQKFPDSARWLNRAASFAIITGDFEEAEQLYEKALSTRRELYLRQNGKDEMKDVLYATALDGLLNALLEAAGAPNTSEWNPAKLDRIFEVCKEYEDSAFAPIAYLRMAQAKSTLGDRAAATEYCRTAVEKAGTNETLASEVLLRMYLIIGAEEVSNYCQQRLVTNPDSLAANFTMFNLAKINGDYGQAVDYISKCVELADANSPYKVEYAVKKAETLTLAYERSSDKNYLRTAVAEYESLLAKMPNNTNVASVLNNLAYLLAENNEKLPEALEYAKRALDAKPDTPGFLDTYAYVLHKSGRDLQAAEFLEAALQHYEQEGIAVPAAVYEHKGMIKERLGARDEALAAYKLALEVGADRLSKNAKQRIDEAIERVMR